MSVMPFDTSHRSGRRQGSRRSPVRIPVGFSFFRELTILGLAAFVYFYVRGLIHARADEAMANGQSLIDLERSLGLYHETRIQGWILGHDWLVTLVNAVYIYGHWPLIAGTLVWLFVAHRERLAIFRSALLISGAIGVFFFVTFPMAPPRFFPELGFVDTVTLHSEAYRVLQPPSLTNQFAAMPSLHVGWNLLMGIAIVAFATNRFAKAFGVLMPLAMYAATIFTGNHFVLDGIVGSVIALTGLAVAWKISAPKPVSARHSAASPAMSPLYALRR